MIFSNLNSNSGVFPGPSMSHVTLWSLNLPEKKNGCRSVNKRKIKTIVESVATSWFSCSLVQHTNLLLRRKWTNHVTERPHQSEWAKLKEGVVVRVSLCWDSYLLFSFLSLPLVTRSSPQTFVWWKLPPPLLSTPPTPSLTSNSRRTTTQGLMDYQHHHYHCRIDTKVMKHL